MSGSTTPAGKLSLRQRLRQKLSAHPATAQTSLAPQSPGQTASQNVASRPQSAGAAHSAGQNSNSNIARLSSQQRGLSQSNPPPTLLERALQHLSSSDYTALGKQLSASSSDAHIVIGQAIVAAKDKRQACLDKRWNFTIAGRRIVLREEADKVIAWLDRFKAVGDVVANVDPVHVGLPWAGIRLLLQATTAEAHQMACLLVGCETALYMTSRLKVYTAFAESVPVSLTRDNLEESIVNFNVHILHFLARAIQVYESSAMRRFFSASGQIDDILEFENKGNVLAVKVESDANSCERLLELQTMQQTLEALTQLRQSQMSLDHLHLKLDLGEIPYVKGAIFNSVDSVHNMCHPHTRVDLLDQVQQWARETNGRDIFWLQGAAGAGKSTISCTFANWLTEQSGNGDLDLGASFFFKRGESDRGSAAKFFPTIVRQLILKVPGLDGPVAKVVEQDPFIFDKALGEQFRRLLQQPLQDNDLFNDSLPTLIVVVDALDECENDRDIEAILQIWLELFRIKNNRIRLFLTSRPDPPIRLKFKQMSANLFDNIVLQDAVPQHIIEQDLRLYLRDNFAGIREQALIHQSSESVLDQDWPGDGALKCLVEMSSPLFIVAATICRFVGDREFDPSERLDEVLSLGGAGPTAHMESMYLPVLNHLTKPKRSAAETKTLCEEFRVVVGSIVSLVEPLSVIDLATLLNKPVSSVTRRLSPLHSVLRIPADQLSPICLLHLSFAEFLLGENSQNQPFGIDGPFVHSNLATQCLQILSRPGGLRENMLALDNPGQVRQEISRSIVINKLSPVFQYACQHWVHHIHHSRVAVEDGDKVHVFLQTHYLHWLEALSFMGKTSEPIRLLKILRSVTSTAAFQMLSFLEDARRFILKNRYLADLTPLQLYSSALIFAPEESSIREGTDLPEWLLQHRKADAATWGPELLRLEGHSSIVYGLAFSPDDALLASASHDCTIRLWSTATGQEVQKLEGHTDAVLSVAFSCYNDLLASVSLDWTVRLWSLSTGQEVQRVATDSNGGCVAISHKGSLLAFASRKAVIHIWDFDLAKEIQKLEGHTSLIRSLKFCHSDTVLASAATDGSVRLWNLSNGQETNKLEGQSERSAAMAITSDGTLLASLSSDDEKVRLWKMPAILQLYELDRHDYIGNASIAFSPNGSLLAVTLGNSTVRLWNTSTGEPMYSLAGHTEGIMMIAFSHQNLLIASASLDHTMRIWEFSVHQGIQKPAEHISPQGEVEFSPSGSLLATASYGSGNICLWDLFTGQKIRELEGCASQSYMAFSHDESLLAYTSPETRIRIWDVSAEREVQEFPDQARAICGLVFSREGHLLVSASVDGTVKLWSLLTGHELHTLDRTSFYSVVSFSHDDSMIALASLPGKTVSLFNTSTGIAVQKIQVGGEETHWFSAVATSHSGSQMALAIVSPLDQNCTVQLWDLSTCQVLKTFDGLSFVRGISFASNDDCLLTNLGAIDIDTTCFSAAKPALRSHQNVFLERDWVIYQETRILWIPQDYRWKVHLHGNVLVFEHDRGQISIMQIVPDRLPFVSGSATA